jgi:glutathione S-transferase
MEMEMVALVTLLLIIEYIIFAGLVGKARVEGGVDAPAMTGDPTFERASRVQLNTAEQLIITIPAMWICGSYFRPDVAAILGGVFFIGRFVYRGQYMREPSSRLVGMVIGFLANIGLVLTGAWGVVSGLL